MENKQDENKTEKQLVEQIKDVVDDLNVVSVEIDENTAKKLQNHFTKKEQGQD